jgi:hypothetical protein
MAPMSLRWGILALAAILASCSATPPAPAPPPPSAAATEVPPPAPTASASASAAAAAKPLPDTRVRDACAKLCERVNTSCAEGRGEACLARCASYEAKSAGCEAVTAAAFTCQLNAPEGFCHSVVAPRCVDAFAGMMRCHRGEAPVQESAPKAQELPAGWERVSDTTWGLAFPLPKGAALDSAAKSRTWRATAEGASYEVIELPMPAGKLDDRAFIKLVIAHLGVACQREMKLGGRVDDATHTFIRFETGCTGKERLYGKIYVDQKHAISMLVRGEQNSERREVFLESVQ